MSNAKCPAIKRNCKICGRRNPQGREICECGADLHCKKYCVPGYSRCEDHGGPSPKKDFYGRGTLVTGSSSSFPLTRLAAKYHQMQKDGRLLSNRQAIDVVDSRIVQLLERVDVEDAPDRMKRLYELWNEYVEAHDSGRTVDEIGARKKLENEFEKAYHDYAAWEQMFTALDLRRKMVESEVKVLTAIKAIITAEDAYEMMAKMLAAVQRVVNDDPKRMKQVQYEFARIIGEVSDNAPTGFTADDGRSGGEGGGSEGFGDVDQAELLHPRNEE